MNRFTRAIPDPQFLSATRADLLSKPPAFFASVFQGRIPTAEEKLQLIEQSMRRLEQAPLFANDVYIVQIEETPPFYHLNIHRHDWAPCKDWRDFQTIKNELIGTENEAVELFPAESRLVDTSNTYHLWVHMDRTFRFPLGLAHRLVSPQGFGQERQRLAA